MREAHERGVSMTRTGRTCTRGRNHTHVASGKSLHLREVANPSMRGDESTARRDRQNVQEGQVEGIIEGGGDKTGVAPERQRERD